MIANNINSYDKARCKYELHGFDHNTHLKAFSGIYDIISNNFIPQNIIDLTSLSGVSSNFHDHIHPTKEGTSKIAEIVADSIINNYFKHK